jgi:O-antigen/teichoic acid export membrane protein
MTAAQVVASPPAIQGRKLYRDAASLASSSMLTALLGVGFWAVCARYIPPATLGVQTALLSIIVAPAVCIGAGMGDAFTAVVPASGVWRSRVVDRGYQFVLRAALPAAFVAAALAITVLPQVRYSIGTGLLVFVGVLVWSLFTVQDPALTSMGRAHWLPIENGSVSLVKIGLLPVGIAIGVYQPVLVATLVPSLIAVAFVLPALRQMARPPAPAAAAVADPLRQLPHMARRTIVSGALTLGTLTASPFLVTASAGPTQGAVFSLGLSIVQSLDFVGAALGVSLVVHASAAVHDSGRMALIVFKRTAAVVGAGAVVLVGAAPFLLHVLNPRYLHLHGALVIAILAAGSVTRCLYVIWAALQKARRAMRAMLVYNCIAAGYVLVVIAPVGARWGAVGAAAVVASANALLSAFAAGHLIWQRREQRKDPTPKRGRHRSRTGALIR